MSGSDSYSYQDPDLFLFLCILDSRFFMFFLDLGFNINHILRRSAPQSSYCPRCWENLIIFWSYRQDTESEWQLNSDLCLRRARTLTSRGLRMGKPLPSATRRISSLSSTPERTRLGLRTAARWDDDSCRHKEDFVLFIRKCLQTISQNIHKKRMENI